MSSRKYSKEEKKRFHYERFNHPHPRVQQRMEIMWLKSKGLKTIQIASLAGVSENTVRKYVRVYEEGGIDKLKEINFNQPKSELDKYTETIERYFLENPPQSIKEATVKIEELTGIKRSENQVRKFLKRIGIKRLEVGYVPGYADMEGQEGYIEKKLEARWEEVRRGERVVFWGDGVYFLMKEFLGYIWCFTRIFIKSLSYRKRKDMLAAFNTIFHGVITVTNDTYVRVT